MPDIQSHLFDTDYTDQQQKAFNYTDAIRQSAAKYQAGGQFAQQYGLTGAALTQAQAGDIPAAEATQTYGQDRAAAAQKYMAQGVQTFATIAQQHATDPDGGQSALAYHFDAVAPEIKSLTGASDQYLAALRQSLITDPQNTLARLQSQLPVEYQKAGDTTMQFRNGQLLNSYNGATNQVVNGKIVQTPFTINGQPASATNGSPPDQTQQPQTQQPAPNAAPGGGAALQVPGAPAGQPPLGMRSNNPGNLQSGGQEATYKNPTAGILAAAQNIDSYAAQGNNTVAGIIGKWAPQFDASGRQINDTPAYIQNVTRQLGVTPTTPLNLHDPNVKGALLEAMFHHENGVAWQQSQQAQPAQGQQGQPQMQAQGQPGGARVIYDGGPTWRQPTPAEAQQYPGAVQVNSSTGETRYAPSSAQTVGQTAPGNTALTGDAYLKTLSPSMQALVKAYSDGRAAVPTAASLRNPTVLQALMATAQYDPTFDQANYPSRAKTRADFTSGKSAQNIRALNTAIGHLGTLNDQISGTASGSLTPINAAENYVSQLTGHAGITNYNQTAAALASELTTVFRGTGGAEADLNRNLAQLSPNASDAQKRGAVKNITDLLASRLNALGDQYNQGMGKISDPFRLLDSKAAQVLQRLGGGAAAGGSPSVPAASQVSGQQPTLPIMATPQDAARLPSGTRFRTPDGRVKVRP